MPDNIGDAVGRIVIDTTSLDAAVRRMQDASSRITRLMRTIEDAVTRSADDALSGSTRMIRAQADAMRAHAQEVNAQARLITATAKAEADKRVSIAREEATRVATETRKSREAERISSTGGAAGTQARNTMRAIQAQLREAEMRLQTQSQRFRSMGGTKEDRSEVQRLIDGYSNDIKDAKIRLQELKKEFANFLRNPGGDATPINKQLNRLNDITSSFSGGVGWEVTPQVSKFGNEQAARNAEEAERRRQAEIQAGIRKETAAREAAAKKDLDNLLKTQQEIQKIIEAKKRAAAQKLVEDTRQANTGAQAGINAARAQIRAMQEELKRLQATAPSNIDLDPLIADFASANKSVLQFQAALSTLRSELQDVATTPQRRMAIIGEMNAIRQSSLQLASQGLDPLRNRILQFNNQIQQATTGVRGYFNRLREELEDINRRSLGKNIQELGFRLSPLGIGAGAALTRGTNVAMELEEANLAFRAMTDSEAEAVDLMEQLTEQSRRFGLPIVETFKSMQRFIPLIRQSGGELDKVIEIAARLQTLNPAQGFEGALFSITEAMASGEKGLDAISLRERFGIVPDQLRQARAETGNLVDALDLVLNRMDRTTGLAEQFGQTTRATFTRARDAIDQFLANAVEPLLNFITPLIEGFNSIVTSLNEMNSPIIAITGIVAALTAGFIAATFAIGNLIIAGEAIASVFAAISGAGAAATAVAGAAGAAGGTGLVAAIASIGVAAAPVIAPLIALAAAIGGIAFVVNRLQTASDAAREQALAPLVEKLTELSNIEVEIPEVPGVGQEMSDYERVQAKLEELRASLPSTFEGILTSYRQLADEQIQGMVDQANQDMAATGNKVIKATALQDVFGELNIPQQLQDEILQQFAETGTLLPENFAEFSLEELAAISDALIGETTVVSQSFDLIIDSFSRAGEAFSAVPTKIDEATTELNNNQFKTTIGNILRGVGQASIDFFGELGEGEGLLDRIREAQEKYNEAIQDYARENERTFDDRSLDAAREIEDFERQRARTIEDYNRQTAETEDDYYRDRQRMIDDFYAQQDNEAAEFNEKSLKQWEDYQKDLERMAEDHLKEMRRMARDVDDAISARDFLAAQEALQKMSDAEEDYQIARQRRIEDFNEQQADLVENLEKQREQRKKDFEQQLKDFDENYQRQKQRRDAAFQQQLAREDEDRRIRLARQLQDYAIMDMRRQEDFRRQLDRLNMHNELMAFYTEYGFNVLEQKALEWATGLTQLQVAQPVGSGGGQVFPTLTESIGEGLPSWLTGTSTSATTGIGGGQVGWGMFADGIWNMPQDMWGQLHAGEIYIPKNFAQSVRSGEAVIGTKSAMGGGSTIIFAPQISVDARNSSGINKQELIESLEEAIIEKMSEDLERQLQGFDFDRG